MCRPWLRALQLRPPLLSSILALLLGLILCASPLLAEDTAESRVPIGNVPRVFAQIATTRVPDFRKSIEPDVRQKAPGETTRVADLTAVPDFRRHTVAEARRMAQHVGLGLEQGNVSARDEGRALVITQSPTAGTTVRKGSVVKVIAEIRGSPVTIPEFPIRVPPVRSPLRSAPNLVKETLYAARKIAANEGFVVGVEGVGPADENRAVVVSQAPTAGTQLPLKSTIRVKTRESFQPPPDTPPAPEFPPSSRYVPVPNLVNRTLLDARRLVERAGLTLTARRLPPEQEDRRVVVGQKPLPETLVPIGTRISVRITRDSSTGLPPSTIVVAPPTTPPGPPMTVPSPEPFEPPVSTSPPIRTPPPGPRVVEPRLSLPDPSPAMIRVPTLVDRTLQEAESLLGARDLTLYVQGGPVPDYARAIVITQVPPAKTLVPQRSTVVVTVHLLATRVTVPNLVGLTLDEARNRVREAKLRLAPDGEMPREGNEARVSSQEPTGGEEAEAGSRVRVRVDSVFIEVPDVRKRVVTEARRHLDASGFRLNFMGPPPDNEQEAVVEEQYPAPGARHPAGSAVVVRTLRSGLPGWVVIATVATAAGIAIGAGIVLATRARAKAGPQETGPPPDLRIVVSGGGWQQEEPADGQILTLPALRLRVRSESRVEPVDTDFPIVTEEVKRHGE